MAGIEFGGGEEHRSALRGSSSDASSEAVTGGTGEEDNTVGGGQGANTLHPSLIGNYKILKVIGKGGMGTVYEAYHTMLHRRVAIKTLSRRGGAISEIERRFLQEMRVTGLLDHPGILKAFDAGVVDGIPYLATELLSGFDLSTLVNKTGKLPPAIAQAIICDAADALGHAHSKGVLHRDVKPANLFMTAEHGLKVLDFGLAVFSELPSDQRFTKEVKILGTLDYLPPEQALDPRSVTHSADIYSLGCTFFYLLTGFPPFHDCTADSSTKKLLAHATRDPPALSDFCDDASKEIGALIKAMLAKNPLERPSSMQEIRDLLVQDEQHTLLKRWFMKSVFDDQIIGNEHGHAVPGSTPTISYHSGITGDENHRDSALRETSSIFAESARQKPVVSLFGTQALSKNNRRILTFSCLVITVILVLTIVATGFVTSVSSSNSKDSGHVFTPSRNEFGNPLSESNVVSGHDYSSVALNGNIPETKDIAEETGTIPFSESSLGEFKQISLLESKEILRWKLEHFRANGTAFYRLGEVGDHAIRVGDDIKLTADLRGERYAYLYAVNTDSSLQRCLPEALPTMMQKVTQLRLYEESNVYFTLTEGAGTQTFYLLLSSKSLPDIDKQIADILPEKLRKNLCSLEGPSFSDDLMKGGTVWVVVNDQLVDLSTYMHARDSNTRGTKSRRGPEVIRTISRELRNKLGLNEVFAISFQVYPPSSFSLSESNQ